MSDKTAANPRLLALTTELSIGSALQPSPDFAQRLRRHLLDKFPAQAHRAAINRRLIWTTFTLCLLAVSIITAFTLSKPSATTVLARAIDAIAIEPGQIVYQTYTSHNDRYQEWQRMDVTPQGHIIPVAHTTIRYAAHDTDFSQPEEWFYVTPEEICNLSRVQTGIRYPERDAEGCRPRDNTDQQSQLAPFAGENLQQRLERLQAHPGDIVLEETTFDGIDVYALTHTEPDPGPNMRIFTRTLYIDAATYLPAGYTYTLEWHSGRIYEWQSTVLDYQIIDPADLRVDPFIWPPPDAPKQR